MKQSPCLRRLGLRKQGVSALVHKPTRHPQRDIHRRMTHRIRILYSPEGRSCSPFVSVTKNAVSQHRREVKRPQTRQRFSRWRNRIPRKRDSAISKLLCIGSTKEKPFVLIPMTVSVTHETNAPQRVFVATLFDTDRREKPMFHTTRVMMSL